MASVGEPINRPRHTEQRDRSQTVLAAPRDTRGRTSSSRARDAPRGPPGRRQLSLGASDYSLGAPCNPEKWGLPPIRSPSCLRNKGLSLKRIGWLYPIFRQLPTLSMDEKCRNSCHRVPLTATYSRLSSTQKISIQHKQKDLTRKQKSGRAATFSAKNLPEMAARLPLEA